MKNRFWLIVLIICALATAVLTVITKNRNNNYKSTKPAKSTCILATASTEISPAVIPTIDNPNMIAQIIREFESSPYKDYISLENQLNLVLEQNPDAISQVMDLFLSSTDENLLFALAKVLQRYAGEEETKELINETYNSDSRRLSAILALAGNSSPGVIDAITWALFNSNNQEVKAVSLYALSQDFDNLPESIKYSIINYAKNLLMNWQTTDPLLDKQSILLISKSPYNEDALTLLNYILQSHKPAEIKMFALSVLGEGRLSHEEVERYLEHLQNSPDLSDSDREIIKEILTTQEK